MGALTQQSIRTYACTRPVPGQNASIPIAQFARAGYVALDDDGDVVGNYMDSKMKVALVAGLARSQTNKLPISCPTGNCTFTEINGVTHSTLAFDSICVDASSHFTQIGNTSWSTDPDDEIFQSWTGYAREDSVVFGTRTYLMPKQGINYSLSAPPQGDVLGRWTPALYIGPDGYYPMHLADQRLANISVDPFFMTTFIVPRTSPCINTSAVFQDTCNHIGSQVPCPAAKVNDCPELSHWNITSFPGPLALTAADCYIYPSVRNYRGAIINGQLEEARVGDPVPLTFSGDIFPAWQHSNFRPPEAVLYNYSHIDPSWAAFSDLCNANGTIFSKSSLSVSAEDILTLPNQGTKINQTGSLHCLYGFPSEWTANLGAEISIILKSPDEFDCTFNNYQQILCDQAWWAADVYNGLNSSVESIQEFLQGIADSLTTELRVIGTDYNGNPAFVTGVAHRTEVCTSVAWEWLLFPIIMTVLTALLLSTVLIPKSRASGTMKRGDAGFESDFVPWKTSVLPMVFYKIKTGNVGDTDTGTDTAKVEFDGKLMTKEEMKELAKTLKVKFAYENGEWGFHITE